ncbi:hypothetical protein [Picosynechococcus sp. NKBG15041c]|uniref:hypothetical protein n=1 Tax=Picosynechococcus sp. NKBG15041c TaxID=1407650 RepID=UPI000424DF47|nr:hypothetical protein [Picosynechococcus sp. NKBG15041c]
MGLGLTDYLQLQIDISQPHSGAAKMVASQNPANDYMLKPDAAIAASPIGGISPTQ